MPKLFQKQKREWENFYLDGEIRTLKEKERDWECLVYIYREEMSQRERDFFFYLVLNFTLIGFFFNPKFFFLILILMCVFLILQFAHISTLIYCPPWLQAFTIILILIFFLVLVYLFHSSTYFLLFCLIIFHSTLSFNQNSVLSSFDGYTFVKK